MKKFAELLEESVITQTYITMLVVTAYVGLAIASWWTGRAMPDALGDAFWAIIGFWFASKLHNIQAKMMRNGGKTEVSFTPTTTPDKS